MDVNIEQRIEQWEKMVREAPDSMAWFSLGNAYRDAERYEDAANAYRKALELDAELSRAYQVLAQVLLKLGQNEEAANVLNKGYVVASEQGDVMPAKAMGALLTEKLKLPLPQVDQPQQEPTEISDDQVIDRRTGRPGSRMQEPPMRGPLGKFIQENFSQETWREWIGMGTKVINELRLDFSRDEHQEAYDMHMMEWLGVSKEELDEYRKQYNAEQKKG